MAVETLKKRAEFLRLRRGRSYRTDAFTLECAPRSHHSADRDIDRPSQISGPRFGFTVTKKVGNAVMRNRIRRRLKEAARECRAAARDSTDYVLIARASAATCPFEQLKRDLQRALVKIHQPPPQRPKRRSQ